MARNVAGEMYESITGQLFEIGRQLRQKGGYPFNPEMLHDYLQDAIEGRFTGERNRFSKIISPSLVLDMTNGTEILADADDVFVYIDSDFRNWKADEPGPSTKEAEVYVHEMTKDATFFQLFGSLSSDVRKLCLTQAQIKNFVKKHCTWLHPRGWATFVLFESCGSFFVASMYARSDDRLKVYVDRFEHPGVWDAECRHRLVVP